MVGIQNGGHKLVCFSKPQHHSTVHVSNTHLDLKSRNSTAKVSLVSFKLTHTFPDGCLRVQKSPRAAEAAARVQRVRGVRLSSASLPVSIRILS